MLVCQAWSSDDTVHDHAGDVEHYQYQYDQDWGCGWRNIQMTCSHLVKNQDYAGKLFGGVDFVPDIPSLQAWLECAWRQGFDPDGASQLGGHVQGSRIWIGTTEAATLLRQFGCRARVVDFVGGGRRGSRQKRYSMRARGASEEDAADDVEEGDGAEDGHAEEEEKEEEEEEEESSDEEGDEEQGGNEGRYRHAETDRHAGGRAGDLRGASECDVDNAEPGHKRMPGPRPAGQAAQEEDSNKKSGGEGMEDETSRAGTTPVHRGIRCDLCGLKPITGTRHQSKWLSNFDLCENCINKPEADEKAPYAAVDITTKREARLVDHRQLMQWVWNYFTDELSTGAEPPHEARDHAWRKHIEDDPVILSGKPPLYFQHQGHSQTLVGVERIQVQPGHAAEVSLLLLDPGQDTAQLAAALREKRGWQDVVKRNLCTLKKPEYQLMYVVPGTATSDELNELKQMRAAQKFF